MNDANPDVARRPPLSRVLGLKERPAAGLLLLLLLADAALIALHVSMKLLGVPQEYTFDLASERGFGEFFQYVQILWAAAMLALLTLRDRVGVYAAWLVVCVVFAADDGLELHERAGQRFADAFPGLGSLAPHLGELVWMAAVGAVLATIVALAYRRAPSEAKAVSLVLAALFGVLVFFGVVIDVIHHTVFQAPVFSVPMTVLEDGGEIVAMSFVVVFLFAVAFSGHRPEVARRVEVRRRPEASPRSRTEQAPEDTGAGGSSAAPRDRDAREDGDLHVAPDLASTSREV